jgi:cytochrome c-type biogenesis protein CcmF
MTAEVGLFFLILAFATSLLQAFCLIPRCRIYIGASLIPAAWLQAFCITLSLATLTILRLQSDFSVVNVVAHSNHTLPLLYKIAGTWGNHEGSMLLWAWVLAMFGAILAMYHPKDVSELAYKAVSIQAIISLGTLAFILFTSNPFERVFPPMPDGEALNPLLQDIALSMHPPLLYLGYVGFSIVFSLAVAAMLQGQIGRAWAYAAHPWILASWSALTLGIGLGSWWAYRVLGWGGFWFWDPVENASLLPWLSGTALLHANIVLKKRGMLAQWVLLLAIITFGMSLLGTFLVRSGVLISVHSFASDPGRGFFILIYIILLLGSALTLFAWRGGKMASGEAMLPLSREGMIVINNLFLLTACATILLGTLYPMFSEWLSGYTLTVGPPYFNRTALPLLAVPLIFAGLTPFMPWKKAGLKQAVRQSFPALLAALSVWLFILAVTERETLLAAAGIGLAVWLAGASLYWLITRGRNTQHIAVCVAHIGAACMVAGITGAGLWKQDKELHMAIGDTVRIAGYELTLSDVTPSSMPNYQQIQARFHVDNSQGRTTLTPEYRMYAIRNSGSSIASIHPTLMGDLYAVIGEPRATSHTIPVRLYYNPMICLLWAGFVLMALGGVIAMIKQARRQGEV